MASKVYPLPNKVSTGGSQPYMGSHGTGSPNNWESRNAYDLDTPKGTPVLAVADGVIGKQLGYLPGHGPSDKGRFAGQRVHLITADNEFYYAHLSKVVVTAGKPVRAGEVIGYTGTANGLDHLHFAAKHGDPIQAAGAAVKGLPPQAPASAPGSSAPYSAAGVAEQSGPTFQHTAPSGILAQGGPPDYMDPGTDPGGMFNPHQNLQNWQQIASQPGASPESQQFLAYAQQADSNS